MKPEEAFGVILKDARTSKGLSQEKLALSCDLDRTFISMLERGQRQPTLTSILALSKPLEIPADQLIKLTMELMHEDS
jgi:transcriptional regulator with XRE-family HTH domain